MGMVIFLVVRGVIGWRASIVMRSDGQQGVLLNVVAIAGAVLAGILVNPMIGGGNIMSGDFAYSVLPGRRRAAGNREFHSPCHGSLKLS